MNNFEEIDLPVYNLYEDFLKMIDAGILEYKEDTDQICLNTVEGKYDNYNFGRGSLHYDWDESYYDHKQGKMIIPLREKFFKEEDFKYLCTQFKGTNFEIVYNAIQQKYTNIGRVRIMISKPKTCLSWHKDDTTRIHFPMKTQQGCLMIIDEETKYLEQNKWYWTNTKLYHTAINSSKENRIHLVATLLDK